MATLACRVNGSSVNEYSEPFESCHSAFLRCRYGDYCFLFDGSLWAIEFCKGSSLLRFDSSGLVKIG